MKYVIATLALAGLMGATALADATGGIVGSVVDSNTGKTLANVPISITRVEARPESWNMKTNAKGAVLQYHVDPGPLSVVATFPGETVGCAIDDVFTGQVVHSEDRRRLLRSSPATDPARIPHWSTRQRSRTSIGFRRGRKIR